MRFTFSGTVHCGAAPPHRDFGADVTSGATIPGETPQPRNHAPWRTPAPVTRPRRQEPPTPTHRATARSQAHLLSAGLAPRNTVRAIQVGPRGGKTTSRNLLESNLHIAMFSLNGCSRSMYVPMLFKIGLGNLCCWEEGVPIMMLHDTLRAMAKERDIVSK